MVAAVIVSMVNSGDGAGLAGSEGALCAVGFGGLLSRRLAIQGEKGAHRARWSRQHENHMG